MGSSIIGFVLGIWLLVSAYAATLTSWLDYSVFTYSIAVFGGYWFCLVVDEV